MSYCLTSMLGSMACLAPLQPTPLFMQHHACLSSDHQSSQCSRPAWQSKTSVGSVSKVAVEPTGGVIIAVDVLPASVVLPVDVTISVTVMILVVTISVTVMICIVLVAVRVEVGYAIFGHARPEWRQQYSFFSTVQPLIGSKRPLWQLYVYGAVEVSVLVEEVRVHVAVLVHVLDVVVRVDVVMMRP